MLLRQSEAAMEMELRSWPWRSNLSWRGAPQLVRGSGHGGCQGAAMGAARGSMGSDVKGCHGGDVERCGGRPWRA
jgi:hypothetical protein